MNSNAFMAEFSLHEYRVLQMKQMVLAPATGELRSYAAARRLSG